MIYFISDNHWGHKSVIRMSNRPFENVHQMNQYMIKQWNDTVNPDDDVFYLGDLMYKMNPNKFVSEILNTLNGKIHLINGNHDERYINKYMDRLEWSKSDYYFEYQYNGKKYKFHLYHYPIFSWRGIYHGSIHLHGHTHTNCDDLYFKSPLSDRMINVNCEFYDYKPLSIIDIIQKFEY